MDGATFERVLERGLTVDDADLTAAEPHWVILQEMAAVLLRDERLEGGDENDNP